MTLNNTRYSTYTKLSKYYVDYYSLQIPSEIIEIKRNRQNKTIQAKYNVACTLI